MGVRREDQEYCNLLIFLKRKSYLLRIQMPGDAHLTGEDSYLFALNKEFDDESE